MPYTPLAPRRWNSSKFLRWRRGAFCLTNFLPLPDSLTTSSSSSYCLNRMAAAHTARGSLFLIESLSKLSILGSSVGPGRRSGVHLLQQSVSYVALLRPLLYSLGGSLLPSTPGPSLIVRQRSDGGS